MLIRYRKCALTVLVFSVLPSSLIFGQGTNGGSLAYTGLVILAAIIFIAAVYLVTENLVDIRATKMGTNGSVDEGGLSAMFSSSKTKRPSFVEGPLTILKKGRDIKIKGAASPEVRDLAVATFAVQPTDFVGMSPIPKLTVEVGDEVKAGDEIFFDKQRPQVKYVSPVSGEIAAVNRGEKRSIAEVVILADKDQKYKELNQIDLDGISREDLVKRLLDSGAWPMLRQRPYNVVADETIVPDNIFISTFDTAPLAPDSSLIIQGQEKDFEAGIKLLSKLTTGKVYLGLNGNGPLEPPEIFRKVTHAEKQWFAGPHPAGNVGVQIHHIKPTSAGSPVWTVGIQEVITLGRLVTQNRYDASRLVAVCGESLDNPTYVRTVLGAKIADLVKDQGVGTGDRRISGDVLSGKMRGKEGFMGYYDDQLTVIPEGNEFEFFGWLLPLKLRPTASRTLPGFYLSNTDFEVTTNTHGEERAFVVTGQYEKVLPMDIYPQHLMKAIITKDFEKMEGLGIYELVEEDVALCEFVCTSKQPLQHILRSGLEVMREQG